MKKIIGMFICIILTIENIPIVVNAHSNNIQKGINFLLRHGYSYEEVMNLKWKENVQLFPTVFENRDVYILSRIYENEKEIHIDYDYLKVINKMNVETYQCDNIYEIENKFQLHQQINN